MFAPTSKAFHISCHRSPSHHHILTRQTLKARGGTMASSHKDSSIQAFFHPTPATSSPAKQPPSSSIGDGFTPEELEEALKPTPAEPWQPKVEYLECEIRDLYPGPRAVTFMGRVANIFDVANAPKTPRSAKGCVKLCVKDDHDAVTVRVWFADHCPRVRLGSLVSVWTNHSWSSSELTLCPYLLTHALQSRTASLEICRAHPHPYSLHCSPRETAVATSWFTRTATTGPCSSAHLDIAKVDRCPT
jgi:hypothetical protein